MDPAGAIGKLGFRRWYERQLYACHGWLVASLLSAFALLALLEDFSFVKLDLEGALLLIAALVSGLLAWYALWRYLSMLLRAQHLSERSTCTRCGSCSRRCVNRNGVRLSPCGMTAAYWMCSLATKKAPMV